jgi:hypothetical protein
MSEIGEDLPDTVAEYLEDDPQQHWTNAVDAQAEGIVAADDGAHFA